MRVRASLVLLLIVPISGRAFDGPDLFEAIRNDNRAVVASQLGRGVDVNTRDSKGATALMHAALYSSPSLVKLLLDRGADANRANDAGATALMWGAWDPNKVRMLLRAGAKVNATAKSGKTPLMIAAAVHGNVESVRMLLKAGADVKARDSAGAGPTLAASQITDATILSELLEHGADPNERTTRLRQTALMNAAGFGCLECVRVLLEAGADPNLQSAEPPAVKAGLQDRGNMTALLWAAPFADRKLIQLLIDRHADPEARDYRGMNALVMAASSESSTSGDVVRLLLPRTKNVNAADKGGLTALDWALKVGNGEIGPVLRDAGVKSTGTLGDPHDAPAGRADIRQAVKKSVDLVQRSNTAFFRASGCMGCHHTMLGGMLVGTAAQRGFTIDQAAAADELKIVTSLRGAAREVIVQYQRPGGFPMAFSLSLISLGAQKYPANGWTDAVVHDLLAAQQKDGSWRGFDQRPPLEYSPVSETAYALRAIQLYVPPGRRAEAQAAVRRAALYLKNVNAVTTEEKVMRLLGMGWAGGADVAVQAATRQLVNEQKEDGGWAQKAGFASDAYATGQSLYALHEVGRVASSDDVYRHGVDYLLKTQYEDGSWWVRSRSVKFQPYFESGFPHGHDQWISAAGTAWAGMALALVVEPAIIRK